MNEDQILYYLFLFVANLGIFVSLTTFMVLKGWIPYPGSESKSDTEHISQQSSETASTDVVLLPNGKSRTSGTRSHPPKSALKREVDVDIVLLRASFAQGGARKAFNSSYPTRKIDHFKPTAEVYGRTNSIPNTTR